MGRQHTNPCIVNQTCAHSLQPAPTWSEEQLKQFLFANPQSLPLDEIDNSFGPLIPVCREIQTDAGPIDLLFANPSGFLTIVETKLCENGDARRKVLAQILDYASVLHDWTYEELDTAITACPKNPPHASLYEIVAHSRPDLDPSDFSDNVARHLRRGDFLLLIVGDGIRRDLERIAEFFQRHIHLNFRFALIELALFQLPPELGGGHLVHPRILARTVEIERAVIRIENEQIVVQPSAAPPSTSNSGTPRLLHTPEQVLQLIRAEDSALADRLQSFLKRAEDYGLRACKGTRSILLKAASGNNLLNFGEFRADCTFRNHGIAKDPMKPDSREPHPIGAEYLQHLVALLPGATVDKSSNPNNPFEWTVKKNDGTPVTIDEILSVQDQYLNLIKDTLTKFAAPQTSTP